MLALSVSPAIAIIFQFSFYTIRQEIRFNAACLLPICCRVVVSSSTTCRRALHCQARARVGHMRILARARAPGALQGSDACRTERRLAVLQLAAGLEAIMQVTQAIIVVYSTFRPFV